MTIATTSPSAQPIGAPINLTNFAWVALVFAVMIAAIVVGNLWLLNFVHVLAGGLWTGIDLFMGFVVGPILRASPFEARRAVITRLTPRTLFIMPTLSIVTGTSGWFLAKQLGFLDLTFPQFWWVAAALLIVTILTVQGLGYLLPTNLRVYFELRKPNPDGAKVSAMMSRYFYVVAFQGAMQVAIIVVMARFATGL
ncbi:MAG TPA: hypothetical protein VKS78_01465 [Roseiarcus sp.]|nr:hypothetical protein [Roseiarcus sp.]